MAVGAPAKVVRKLQTVEEELEDLGNRFWGMPDSLRGLKELSEINSGKITRCLGCVLSNPILSVWSPEQCPTRRLHSQ